MTFVSPKDSGINHLKKSEENKTQEVKTLKTQKEDLDEEMLWKELEEAGKAEVEKLTKKRRGKKVKKKPEK